jgi:ketosteroid isomerase-like protein
VSQSNVDLVRKGLEDLRQRGVEGVIDLIHPEFEAEAPPDLAVEPDVYRGRDGVRRWFSSFSDAVDDVRLEPDEFLEVGDKVVVPLRIVVKGHESGIEAAQALTMVWTIRDGMVIRMDAYPDKSSALEALAVERSPSS